MGSGTTVRGPWVMRSGVITPRASADVRIASDKGYEFSSTTSPGGAVDTAILRHAAATVKAMNGARSAFGTIRANTFGVDDQIAGIKRSGTGAAMLFTSAGDVVHVKSSTLEGQAGKTLKFGSANFLGFTETGADPTTTEYPLDKDWGLHRNSVSGEVFLTWNQAATIKKVLLA